MTDTTSNMPSEGNPDATPTEALPLADQEPVAAAQAASAAPSSGGSHTRTILEVIGGVVAAGLIVLAGAAGFAVGHATGDDDGGRWSMTSDLRSAHGGPDAGAPMPGQGREGGHDQQRGGGFGHRDGDGHRAAGEGIAPQR
jgi:hypothetical protein